MPEPYLIVGLGNPGKAYEYTRHNVGFMGLEALSRRWHIPMNREKFQSRYGKGHVDEGKEPVILAAPQTYMNLSGESVGSWYRWLKMPVSKLIVLFDDMDIPFGTLRLREGGGTGGHRGVESVIRSIGDDAFIRVRMGIGRPGPRQNPRDYVLQKASGEVLSALNALSETAARAVESILKQGMGRAMTAFNRKQAEQS